MSFVEAVCIGGPLDGATVQVAEEAVRARFFAYEDGADELGEVWWWGYFHDNDERDDAGRPVYRSPPSRRWRHE